MSFPELRVQKYYFYCDYHYDYKHNTQLLVFIIATLSKLIKSGHEKARRALFVGIDFVGLMVFDTFTAAVGANSKKR
jgi:hypothetical protein